MCRLEHKILNLELGYQCVWRESLFAMTSLLDDMFKRAFKNKIIFAHENDCGVGNALIAHKFK